MPQSCSAPALPALIAQSLLPLLLVLGSQPAAAQVELSSCWISSMTTDGTALRLTLSAPAPLHMRRITSLQVPAITAKGLTGPTAAPAPVEVKTPGTVLLRPNEAIELFTAAAAATTSAGPDGTPGTIRCVVDPIFSAQFVGASINRWAYTPGAATPMFIGSTVRALGK